MAKLVIIRGLPGSGKSTNAKNFHESIHYEADMYFINSKGEYVFDKQKLHDAHKWCFDSVRIALFNGDDVVVSNTFTTKKELEPYISLCKENDIKYYIITMTGNYGSIHNVPEETLKKMKERWEPIEGETLIQ